MEVKRGLPPSEVILRNALAFMLKQWPALIGVFLAGALLGYFVAVMLPRPYQAIAEVVVDHNVRRVLPRGSANEVAAYLNQETERLEAIAYSDDVWQQVAREMVDVGAGDAMEVGSLIQYVSLPHPQDGVWNFRVVMHDPEAAAALANLWAEAFVGMVQREVGFARRRLALRQLQQAELAFILRMGARCDWITSTLPAVEALEEELQGQDPESPVDLNVAEKASEVLDAAGPLSLGMIAPETVAPNRAWESFLQAFAERLEKEQQRCDTVLQSIEETSAQRLEVLDDLGDKGAGVAPELEVALVRRARVPSDPLLNPVLYMILGGLLGTGLWLLVRRTGRGGV